MVFFVVREHHHPNRPIRMEMMMLLLLTLSIIAPTVYGNEIIATYEWQKVGPTDTLPAGLEIRMDLSGGGKWARLPPKEIENGNPKADVAHEKRCGPSCQERQRDRAEKRRAAGFLLREPKHNDQRRDQEMEWESSSHHHRQQQSSSSVFSMLWQVSIFGLGIAMGVGITSSLRKARTSGEMHEH